LARIFYNRGYRDYDTVRQMLHDELYVPTEPHEFPGMQEAVERIDRTLESNERICVYGDYDVDGVTSTVILMQYLSAFTRNIVYHVPDRFNEGYGMNADVIRELKRDGVSLIITCDCGIANIEEIQLARHLGIDVIVTDHHNIPETLPPALAILNPKMLGEGHKAYNLSGCGMAYFLCAALEEFLGGRKKTIPGKENVSLHFLLDMLAMSLIADVVSLNGENRHLLKKGLECFFRTERPGLKALISLIEKNCRIENEEDIAFQIAPRINAAGRMDNASLAVELFLADDFNRGAELAARVDELNNDRKRIQQDIIEQAVEIAETQKKNREILVLFNEYWHHGIIGIAAGKICEMFEKPAVLLSLKEDGETVVGSARSVEGVDIYKFLSRLSKRFIKFGGHSLAAGISLKRSELEHFIREAEELAEQEISIKRNKYIVADLELNDIKTVNGEFYARIRKAGPYGEGFRTPVFLTRQVTVVSDRITSSNHHIMVLSDVQNNRIPAVRWHGGNESYQGKILDIPYTVNVNTYRGSGEIRLNLIEIIPSRGTPAKVFSGKITDKRGTSPQELAKDYGLAQFFYEGLKKHCRLENVKRRDEITHSEQLVFLSPPVNSDVFREVVALANPEEVVLGFSILPDYSFEGFIRNLLGVLKHIRQKHGGYTSMEYIASLLCVEQPLVATALNFLEYAGKIGMEVLDNERIYIEPRNDKASSKMQVYKKRLTDALLEKASYLKFIQNVDTDKFYSYLN